MIDTHCHLLPAVDDGPRTQAESIGLARRLHEEGVDVAVCTPHFSRRYAAPVHECESAFVQLRAALSDLGVPLHLVLAAEVSPTMMLQAPMEEILRRSIGGRYVLAELQPQTPEGFVAEVLARLEGTGLIPVLAHPERCPAVRRSPDVLAAARARGARVQLVAPSLAGIWGTEARVAAWRLVDEGIADMVASDAHRPRDAVNLGTIARLLEERHGVERRRALFEEVPAELVSGSAPTEATG